MPIVAISIPQLGEGLQEARLIRFLKQPGESVRRDEPLFEMETDKAVTEVESPFSGVIQKWTAEEDSVHEIGAEIGSMETEPTSATTTTTATAQSPSNNSDKTNARNHAADDQAGLVEPSADMRETDGLAASLDTSPATSPNTSLVSAGQAPIPPRTRRYIREKNLVAVVGEIPAAGKRLTPADVDRFLDRQRQSNTASPSSTKSTSTPPSSTGDFQDTQLSKAQQTLNYRMARGSQIIIPAVLETDLDWRKIQACRDQTRASGGPTGFAMVLWCIAQAMRQHASLRSSLSGDGKTKRTHNHVNLGVAVSLPDDDLKTALVRNADTLSQWQFFANLSSAIESARAGRDQIDATTSVSVSNIGAADIRSGIPVVVAPAVATLAIGQVRLQAVPHEGGIAFRPSASLTMTFDHRLVNGVGASQFLSDIRRWVAEFEFTK
jgi:pyruvate dehydrogenase E2 component (dihydrolipoamide acetyltransferase)